MKYQCAIIDDDDTARFLLLSLIQERDEWEVVVNSNTVELGISLLNLTPCDVLFLDVEMPLVSGLDLLASETELPPVILISSHDHYAADGFKFDVVDFISKPATREALERSLAKLLRHFEVNSLMESHRSKIRFRADRSWVVKDSIEISHLQSYSDYVKIYDKSGSFMVNATMKEMENELITKGFMRVHRQFVINLQRVKFISKKELHLDNDVVIKIGPKYAKELKDYFKGTS